MNPSTITETRFFYSDRNRIAVNTKSRCLYNCFTVAQHLSIALKRYVSLYEIEAIEEWEHVLWVKLKGKSPRFVSKKKIQHDCSNLSTDGCILVNLSRRVVPSIDSDGCTLVTYIGYNEDSLARKARAYILSRGLALIADVLPSEGIAAGKWVLRLRGMSLAAVMHIALREVREEIQQQEFAPISDEEIEVVAAQA